MITVARTTTVHRPAGDVFAVIADMTRYPDLIVGITRWDPVGAVAGGVGDRHRVLMAVGSIEAGGIVRITAWRPDRTIGWTAETGVRQQGSWLLSPTPAGTEVTLRLGFDLAGPVGGLVERIASISVGRKLAATLATLRHVVEHPPR